MVELTPYQKGNRDGLLALATWAEELEKAYLKDYSEKSDTVENNSLTSLRYEMSAKASLHKAVVYREVANHARRLSEALPIEP